MTDTDAAALQALALQHYPAAPDLRALVASYFSVDGPVDTETLALAAEPGQALLLFDLGADGPAGSGTRLLGPVFGAVLKAAGAARSAGALHLIEGDALLRRGLRTAPSMAVRIVTLDRYLRQRLATG